VKSGARALGVAESYCGDTSTLAGVVVRVDRSVDGFAFETCTVGGTDSTAAICSLFQTLDRADIRYLFVAGIAPAWYNVVDIQALHEQTDLPVLAVSFEASDGLTDAIEAAFDTAPAATRVDTYQAQPPRRAVDVGDETVYLRSVGLPEERAVDVLRAYTPAGGRPEPLRVARLAARGVDIFRETQQDL
jgi:endonuclease V-like protein UPF0215 family